MAISTQVINKQTKTTDYVFKPKARWCLAYNWNDPWHLHCMGRSSRIITAERWRGDRRDGVGGGGGGVVVGGREGCQRGVALREQLQL